MAKTYIFAYGFDNSQNWTMRYIAQAKIYTRGLRLVCY